MATTIFWRDNRHGHTVRAYSLHDGRHSVAGPRGIAICGLQRLEIVLIERRRRAELVDRAVRILRVYAFIVIGGIDTLATIGRQQLLVDHVVNIVAKEAAVAVAKRDV